MENLKMSSPLEWKTEPVSPQSSEDSWVSEDVTDFDLTAFYDDHALLKSETDIDIDICLETKAEKASRLLEGLDSLQDLDEYIKEESYSWLEEKILVPIFEDVGPQSPATAYSIKAEPKPTFIQIPDTQSLLQEFETVFNDVEMTHGPLTPPQSPPRSNNVNVLVTLQPLQAPPTIEKIPIPNVTFMYPGTPQPDVAKELAAVDELLRTRAEDAIMTVGYQPKEDDLCSSSSSSSGFGDDSCSEDPEWIPESVQTLPESPEPVSAVKKGRKRSKPYARVSQEDKKSRKKEQNKNAATRYRQKKKQEVEVILGEEKGLQEKNDELKTQVVDVQREIKYLKGLMRDLFKAKGLIN